MFGLDIVNTLVGLLVVGLVDGGGFRGWCWFCLVVVVLMGGGGFGMWCEKWVFGMNQALDYNWLEQKKSVTYNHLSKFDV